MVYDLKTSFSFPPISKDSAAMQRKVARGSL